MYKIDQWIVLSDEDYDAATTLFHSGKWKFTVFHCQQAIEKCLKAFFIKTKGEMPPLIHNLFRLAEQIGRQEFTEDHMKFFSEMSFYYLASRYPEDLQKMREIGKKEKAGEILRRTGEIMAWIKNKLS